MAVELDEGEHVVALRVGLARRWLAESRVNLANGGDLAQSLLRWLGPVDPAMARFADQLMAAATRSAGALVGPGWAEPPPPEPEVERALRLFVGPSPRGPGATIAGVGVLTVQDVLVDGEPWLELRWTAPGDG